MPWQPLDSRYRFLGMPPHRRFVWCLIDAAGDLDSARGDVNGENGSGSLGSQGFQSEEVTRGHALEVGPDEGGPGHFFLMLGIAQMGLVDHDASTVCQETL